VTLPVKKDRSMSKEMRIKAIAMEKKKKAQLASQQKGDVSEEDARVLELVLKGVNVLLVKAGMASNATELIKVLGNDIDILFKLSHHHTFRI